MHMLCIQPKLAIAGGQKKSQGSALSFDFFIVSNSSAITTTGKRNTKTMPEATNSIDYVMEKASGPHFSGLRLDGLLSSPPSSATNSPAHRNSSASASASPLAPKQPFVIGDYLFFLLSLDFLSTVFFSLYVAFVFGFIWECKLISLFSWSNFNFIKLV